MDIGHFQAVQIQIEIGINFDDDSEEGDEILEKLDSRYELEHDNDHLC
jgi:hypothetical protein